jgi:hypothetical protein
MTRRQHDGVDFLKIITVLATTFGVSLGLCGLTALMASKIPSLMILGWIELVAMVLSLGGIIVLLPLWVVVGLIHGGGGSGPEPQRLFDDPDRDGNG